jgi:hypothetical protein
MKEIIAEEKVLFVGQLEYTAHTGAVCCCINDDVSRYSVIISSDGLPARSDTTLLPNLYFLFNILIFTFFLSLLLAGWLMVGSPKLFNEFSISLPTGFFSFKKFYPPSFSLLASFHFLYNSGEEQQQQHNVFLFNNTDPQQLKELSRNNNSYKRRRD